MLGIAGSKSLRAPPKVDVVEVLDEEPETPSPIPAKGRARKPAPPIEDVPTPSPIAPAREKAPRAKKEKEPGITIVDTSAAARSWPRPPSSYLPSARAFGFPIVDFLEAPERPSRSTVTLRPQRRS
jgi:hypothetical protein